VRLRLDNRGFLWPFRFAPNNVISNQLTTQWLYDLAADRWSYWLPTSTIQSIRSGGYYTVLVRHGFRLVVLNNNDCYTYNFWILHNPQHLTLQLQWLHNTLLAAERTGEKVHILAHVPSGQSSCFRVWAREYRRILDRFWDTIIAQFNGHTHEDEFNVLYARDNPEFAVGQAWNGGSATAYSDVNLNYVVYTVDRESFEVLDVDSYYYNLTEANMHTDRRPVWEKLYNFREQFGLADVSPASLDGLVYQMAANHELLHEHWVNTVKAGDTSLARGCNNNCLLNTLCDIVVNEMGDNRKCEELAAIFEANLR
jgi:sphingomyelin phosphodiesterase